MEKVHEISPQVMFDVFAQLRSLAHVRTELEFLWIWRNWKKFNELMDSMNTSNIWINISIWNIRPTSRIPYNWEYLGCKMVECFYGNTCTVLVVIVRLLVMHDKDTNIKHVNISYLRGAIKHRVHARTHSNTHTPD